MFETRVCVKLTSRMRAIEKRIDDLINRSATGFGEGSSRNDELFSREE
jgi:hypothetical protein